MQKAYMPFGLFMDKPKKKPKKMKGVRSMKKFLSLALAFVMTLSLAAPALAAEKEDEAITILYTNDTHCYISNTRTVKDGETETKVPGLRYSTIAAYKDSLEDRKSVV